MNWTARRTRRIVCAVAVPSLIAATAVGIAGPASANSWSVNSQGCNYSGWNAFTANALVGNTSTTNCNGVKVTLYGWNGSQAVSKTYTNSTGRSVTGSFDQFISPLQTTHHAKNAAGSWGAGFALTCC